MSRADVITTVCGSTRTCAPLQEVEHNLPNELVPAIVAVNRALDRFGRSPAASGNTARRFVTVGRTCILTLRQNGARACFGVNLHG
jgi:hypothetical protein